MSFTAVFKSVCPLKVLTFWHFPSPKGFTFSSSFPKHLANGATLTQLRAYSLPVRMANARLRAHVDDIFKAAVTSVLPHTMVTKTLKRDGDRLTIGDRHYMLRQNVHIVAFGKAVIGMVRAAEDMLGDHVVDGIASVPWSIQDTMKRLGKW